MALTKVTPSMLAGSPVGIHDYLGNTVSGNTTIPNTVVLVGQDGLVVTVNTGVTLTIEGSFTAGLFQVFDCQGTGKVLFTGGVVEVYPQWFGAKGDGVLTNDDGPAINLAIDSLDYTGATGDVGVIRLVGDFVVQTQIRSNPTTGWMNLSIVGNGTSGGIISRMATSDPLLLIGSQTGGSTRSSTFTLKDFALIGSPTQAQPLLQINQGQNYTVENLGFLANGPAIEIYGTIAGRIIRPVFSGSGILNTWGAKLSGSVPGIVDMTYAIYAMANTNAYTALIGLFIESPTVDGGTYPYWFERSDGASASMSNITIGGTGYAQNFANDFLTLQGGTAETKRIYNISVSGVYLEGVGGLLINGNNAYSFNGSEIYSTVANDIKMTYSNDICFVSCLNLGKFDFSEVAALPTNFAFINSNSNGHITLSDSGSNPFSLIGRTFIQGSTITGSSAYYGLQTNAGQVRAPSLYATTALHLTDGVSAPSTESGYAQIYVDTADGDLKVKFGDGTVKTIVTDV